MKELSIEEKAKAYDEAIKYARYLINERCKEGTNGSFHRADLDKMFPELAESEDERIRKSLLAYIKGESKRLYIDEWIAWIEKQGEKLSVYQNVLFKIATILSQHEDKEGSPLEQIRSIVVDDSLSAMGIEGQKLTDKVKPKFKVGDKIIKSSKSSCPVHTSTDDTICKVAEIHDTCYVLDTKEGKVQEPFKWQDYYKLVEQNSANWLQELEDILANATPKQLAEWKEKYFKDEPAWSKEDEIALGDALWCCEKAASIAKDENDMGNIWYAERWLKSLKDRYTCKPSDEQTADAFIEKAEEFIYSALNDGIMGTANIEAFMKLFKKYMKGE